MTTKRTLKLSKAKPDREREAAEVAVIEAKADISFFDLTAEDKEVLFTEQARKGAQRTFNARDVNVAVVTDKATGKPNQLDFVPTCGQEAKSSHAALALAGLVGSQSPGFVSSIASQACNVGSPGNLPDADGINFVLGVVKGIEPRDQLEAMLAMQMAAVHLATIDRGRRMLVCEDERRHEYERAFNRLARTFTAQMEALKKYRSDGKQTVRVERVNVEAGGQAVVGDVHHAGGEGGRKNDG